MTNRFLTAFAAVALIAGCAHDAGVDDVPVGTDVVLTRDDGGVVEGTLSGRDETEVKVDVGPVVRTIKRDQITDVRPIDHSSAEEPVLPASAKFREYTVPAGTRLALELETPVSSETSRVDDEVRGRLTEAIAVDGVTVLPEGTMVRGAVTTVVPAGKVKGRARLAMRFTQIVAGDETYAIAAPFDVTAPSTRRDDAQKIGIPAAGGAVVGAILGGKKGAAIGAAVGGGAGTAHVLLTEGKDVVFGPGTSIGVSLTAPIDVKIAIVRGY
jgi:hypothetical protein